MYQFKSRVRYSEIDSEGQLKMEALLDYFQDISTFHSEDLGVGVDYLSENKMIWLMSYWQIDVERFPKLGEFIVVSTAPYEFKSFLGSRNFLLETEGGEMLACANSVWTLMDTEKQIPVRPTEKMLEKYVLHPKLPMEYLGRKIKVPKEGEQGEHIVVRQYHLDTNHHVNNGQYVRIASAYLPENVQIRQLRAEYKKSALLGDEICPYICKEGNVITISLNDKMGEPYCVVAFKIESADQNE